MGIEGNGGGSGRNWMELGRGWEQGGIGGFLCLNQWVWGSLMELMWLDRKRSSISSIG